MIEFTGEQCSVIATEPARNLRTGGQCSVIAAVIAAKSPYGNDDISRQT